MATMDVLKLDAAETLTVAVADEPVSAVLWCSEDDVTWTLEYVTPLGDFLDHASISWAAGTLTVTTTGTLWLSTMATFDRALTVAELAQIMTDLGAGAWTWESMGVPDYTRWLEEAAALATELITVAESTSFAATELTYFEPPLTIPRSYALTALIQDGVNQLESFPVNPFGRPDSGP